MRVAIVHDYLFQYGGAEKVVEKWMEMYPEADIYTCLFTSEKFKSSKLYNQANAENRIKTTWLQNIFKHNFALKFFKHFFWLYPIVMSFWKVKNYDLVLISSTYCAKNVRYENCPKIIHYCHSPTRFLHGLITETDHKSLNFVYRTFIPIFTFWLKWMDLKAVEYLNKNGCKWVANAKFIQTLIREVYHTDSVVIYPPIETQNFWEVDRKMSEMGDEFYLCHGRISFHKRIDLAIAACLRLGKKLKIGGAAGFQKEMDDLVKIVTDFESKNPDKKGLVEFLGRTTDEQYLDLLASCKSFLFPGKEDSGMTPIEVLAAGVPVIAYQAGGALEYIQDDQNGIFFPHQEVDSLVEAILKFESKKDWDLQKIKESSIPFSAENFVSEFNKLT